MPTEKVSTAAAPQAQEQFADFTKQIPYNLVPTNIPGAFASPAITSDVDPSKVIIPILEPQIGKTHHLRGAKKISDTSYTSDNWAGGVLKGTWGTAVGSWSIPTVSKPTEGQGQEGGWNSSSWVGLDGAYGSDDVLQAGVQQRVDGNGNASYVAWYEWWCGVQKQTLGDTSPLSPSLASLNGRLYIAWKGDGNDNLNVMYSSDNGQTFGNKYTSPETSPRSPAICAHNGNLYIAWKGDGNDNLNVAQVNLSGSSITGFSHKVTLGDTSPLSPSLASLNGRLYLAWKGDGNDNLNVMYSSNNGQSFGNKYTSGETSPQAPGLGVHNNNLYITWKGDGNDNLNVAIVDISGASITGFSQKVTLGDTSQLSPCLASLNGRLYLSWKGDGNDNLNVMYSSNNGQSFGNKYVSPETSPQFTTLAVNNGSLFIGWKGDGNDNLNVSLVGIDGSAITGFTTPPYLYQTNITNFPVSPGNKVSCTVQYSNNVAGALTFTNQTTGKHFTITLVPPPGASFDGNCAEWIMEAPDGGYPNAALPKFTPVDFTGATASHNGTNGNPQNGDTWNIAYNNKTLTSVKLASDEVTVSFAG
jgi:hypothetical protein